MSTGVPWTKNMWFSSLRLLASEAGRTLVKACKDWERMKKDHQIIPIEVQPVFGWLDGQALVAVLNETCIAELNFSRKDHFDNDAKMDVATVQAWCCKSLTVPTSPERCKVQVLAKALESNDHVTHLNLEFCKIEVEDIQVGSLVWDPVSGVEVRGDKLKLCQILQTFLIHSTYSAVAARSMLDSGWHWLAHAWSFEDQ